MGSGADKEQESSAWQKSEQTFEGKRYSEYFDPCQEAATKSMRCLARNGGDKDLCQDYFTAYRECKKQWLEERAAAKRERGSFA